MMREASGTVPRVFARYGTTPRLSVTRTQNGANVFVVDHTELGKEKQEALAGELLL